MPDEMRSFVSARRAELAAAGLQVHDLNLVAIRDAAELRAALADVHCLESTTSTPPGPMARWMLLRWSSAPVLGSRLRWITSGN